MRSRGLLQLPASLLVLLVSSSAAALPYNPTWLLKSPLDNGIVYVLQQSPSSESQFELSRLNTNSGLDADNLFLDTLYDALPFLENGAAAFTPAIDAGGNITVYTGNCSLGASGAVLWRYTPDPNFLSGKGAWTEEKVSPAVGSNDGALAGANYLASGISFSSSVKANTSTTNTYVFGGMCPVPGNPENKWQSSATYSNYMLRANVPPTSGSALGYNLGITSTRGAPIAEAGMSITALEPTYSKGKDGSQVQQQDFVLIGGHTSAAFLNMSQVALFSLPQETWTFIAVDQPTSGGSELAIRADDNEIDSRSGHTALLSPDGNSIIVFGGWVGDVDNPAVPQLAILNIGDSYGGSGPWKWSVPSTTGQGPPDSTGIYGHGALMLPGNVMMIAGGYQVTAPTSKLRSRATQTRNTKAYFFNVTSSSWISSYNPQLISVDAENSKSGPLSKPSQKAGLGIGIVIGCAAVAGIAFFCLWYRRGRWRNRNRGEKDPGAFRNDTPQFNAEGLSGEIGQGEQLDSPEYMDDRRYPGQSWRSSAGSEAERTGLQVEIPSPTRGLRRSLHGRYEAKGKRVSGNFETIVEREEDEQMSPEMAERPGHESSFSNATTLDPFSDPDSLANHPVGVAVTTSSKRPLSEPAYMSAALERAKEVQSWVSDWERAAGALLNPGRTSPTKSDRTGSNLSDRSMRSNLTVGSSTSNSGGTSKSNSLTRTLSLRSAALLSSIAKPFIGNKEPATSESPSDRRNRARSSSNVATEPHPGSSGRESVLSNADSFVTARSGFGALMSEGEALLNCARPADPHTGHTRARSLSGSNLLDIPDSPTRDGGRPRSSSFRRSWMGSVKRVVLGRADPDRSERAASMMAASSAAWYDKAGWGSNGDEGDASRSSASSPTKHCYSVGAPRRAASDASFWRSKQGARDWGVEPEGENNIKSLFRSRSGDDWGAPEDRYRKLDEGKDGKAEQEEEEDWDVEAAAERRVVQLMFTVPKQRLRVVNADLRSLVSTEGEDIGGSRSASVVSANAGLTRAASTKAASMKTVMEDSEMKEQRGDDDDQHRTQEEGGQEIGGKGKEVER